MSIRHEDHTEVRNWLAAAERGDFAHAHDEKSMRAMVFSTFGGGWGSDYAQGMAGWFGGLLGEGAQGRDQIAYEREAGPKWDNPAVAACLRILADNVPQPVPQVTEVQPDGDIDAVASPCIDLVRNPNGHYSYPTLMASWINSAILDGNGYLVKIRSAAGIPVQLWWVPTWTIWPRFYPDQPNVYIDHYEYRPGQGIWRIDPRDIIHLRYGIMLDPRNDRLMMSALKAAASRSICSLNECDAFIASLMRNSGVPQTAIVPTRTDVLPPTPDQAEMMRSQYRTLTHGERRGDPFIATGPFQLVKIGYSPEELALDHIPNRLQDDVHGLIGVPAMLTGLTSGAVHKTYCLPADARISTLAGPKAIADVRVGDMVWSLVNGELVPRSVLRSGKTGNKPLYEIRTKNRILRASGNHPVLTRIPGTLGGTNAEKVVRYGWKPVDQLVVGDMAVQAKSLPDQLSVGLPNGRIPTAEFMQFCGAVVGDGTLVEVDRAKRLIVAMPTNDRAGEWYREVSPRLFTKFGGAAVAVREVPRAFEFCSKPPVEELVELGFGGRAKTKRIPGWVFAQPRDMRLHFLAGIVDSDGAIDKRGALTVGLCNKDLVLDVRDLMISLGIQCSNLLYTRYDASVLPNPGKQESYDNWRFTASSAQQVAEIPFVDPLYRDRVNLNPNRFRSDGFDAYKTGLSSDLGFYSISAIELLPAEDVYDIEVDEGHSFIADGVVVHNSNLAEARRALYEDTIIPIQSIAGYCLTRSLLGDVGMGDNTRQTFGFSYDGIECLQEQRDLRDARAVANYVGGIWTLAESRRVTGKDATEEDEVFQIRLDTRLVQRNQLAAAIEQDRDKLSSRVLAELQAGAISLQEARAQLGMPPLATTGDTVLLPTTAQPMLQGDPLPNSPEAAAAMTEATAPAETEPAGDDPADPFADTEFDDNGDPIAPADVANAKAVIAAVSRKLGITITVEPAAKPKPKTVKAMIRAPLALEVSPAVSDGVMT